MICHNAADKLTHHNNGMAGDPVALRIMLTKAKEQYKVAATTTKPFNLFWTCREGTVFLMMKSQVVQKSVQYIPSHVLMDTGKTSSRCQ